MMHLLSALALASTLTGGATIQGTVRAEGSLEPIAHATVALPELRRAVTADAKGYFVLSDVPQGRWQVRAGALGYADNGLTVVSDGRGTLRLDFELERRPVELQGIDVEGDKRPATPVSSAPGAAGPAAVRVDGPRLKLVPGLAEPDVLRALQMLPSIGAISDFSSALYVRGGSADQNLITLDGVPLFNPYHVGGIFSAIGADAVSTVDVHAGAHPARAGDRLASTVAIHTRDGGRDRVRASGAVGLISAHATLDGPLPGGDGSFLFTGRRTYLDAATDGAYALGLIDATIPYGFDDAYLKATHDVGEIGKLSLSGYVDREGIRMPERMRDEMDGDVQFGWGARMLSLGWRQPLGGSLLLEARAGYSGFHGTFDAWEFRRVVFQSCGDRGCTYTQDEARDTTHLVRAHTSSRDALAGADLTWYNRAHTVRGGVQLDSYFFDHALEQMEDVDEDLFPLFARVDRPRTLAAYVEDEWKPADGLELRAGVRVLEAGAHGRAWLPRLGAHWRAAPGVSLSLGAGRYAQVLRSMRDDESVASSFIAYDLFAAQPDGLGLASGEDVVVGAEWAGPNTTLRVDAYAKRMENLLLAPEPDDPLNTPPLVIDDWRAGSGTARGLELLLAHRRGRADFTLAYALASAERRAGEDVFTPRFQRRQTLDATAALPWGERGVLSARAAYGSGQPYTPALGLGLVCQHDPAQGGWDFCRSRVLLGEHNSDRLPGYFRLDVAARRSFDKRWFGREGSLTPFLQILNVLNTRNALIAEAQPYGRPQLSYWPQLPFLPTFGVEWTF